MGDALSDADYESLRSFVGAELDSGKNEICIYSRGFRIPVENADWVFYLCRIEERPEITRYNYSYTGDGYIYELLFERWTENDLPESAAILLDGIKGNDNLTDVQKALLLHDRIAAFSEYDSSYVSDGNDSATGVFVSQKAVCTGYASAYELLLKQCGIEAACVSSTALNHIWNIVGIDGNRYHTDITWDDPLIGAGKDLPGYVQHVNFLRSSDGIKSTGHNADDFNDEPSSADYDSASTGFWQHSITQFVLLNGRIYYMDNYVGNQSKLNTYIEGGLYEWTPKGSVAVRPRVSWKGSSLALINTGDSTYDLYTYNMLSTDGKDLFYTNGKIIYRYNPEKGGTPEKVLTLPGSVLDLNVIYGFKYEDGAFMYKVGQTAAEAAASDMRYYCYAYHKYENNICVRCGDSRRLSQFTSISVSHSCTVENDLSLNYYFTLGAEGADFGKFDNVRLVITKTDFGTDGSTVRNEYILTPSVDKTKGYSRYKFTFKNIAASEVGNALSAALVCDYNGRDYYSGSDSYNIKKYAYTMIGLDSSGAGIKKLLVDLLNYSAESQLWFGLGTDNLVNAELTEEQRRLGTTEPVDLSTLTLPTVDKLENPEAKFVSRAIVLGSNIEIKYYMTFPVGTDISGVSIVFEYFSAVDGEKKVTVPGSQFVRETLSDGTVRYSAKLTTIRGCDLGQPVKAVIMRGSEQISSPLMYSVEYYAKTMIASADSDPGNKSLSRLKPLLVEMVKFIRSSKAYFENK
ncbi:MAG: hypothetical protein MJ137_05850 [Clostridia bacterium]|nr:hypothetical protein [Clostridia bacterium]